MVTFNLFVRAQAERSMIFPAALTHIIRLRQEVTDCQRTSASEHYPRFAEPLQRSQLRGSYPLQDYTIIGSRATGLNLSPKLTTRGLTLSASPRSITSNASS